MKKIYLYMAIAISCFLCFNSLLYSQIECPPAGGGQWSNGSVMKNLPYYGDQGSVNYQYRVFGSNWYEIKVDWSALNNNSEFISDKVLKEMLVQQAMKDIIMLLNQGNLENWEGFVTYYYQTECKVDRKVYYNLNYTTEFECCDEGGGQPTENWYIFLRDQNGQQTHQLIAETRQITCGYKCCRKTYHLQSYFDDYSQQYYISVTGTPVIESVTDCNCTTTYIDCGTQLPVPCTGDCGE